MRSIRTAPATLGEHLFAEFSQSLRDHNLSPVTARGYGHDLERFRAWMEQNGSLKEPSASNRTVPLDHITAVDLINYRHHLIRAERLQATTINRKIQALKKFFRWDHETGRVSR